MADTMKTTIWLHRKRPCVVTEQQRVAKPKIGGRNFGTYERLTVEYLDGQEPRIGYFGIGAWGTQATAMKGAQKIVWCRVRELIDGGMTSARAQVQAMAELQKGVLSHGGSGPQEAVF